MITPKLALLTALFGCSLLFVSSYVYNLAFIPENLRMYVTLLVSTVYTYAFCYFIQENEHKL